jgi:hypothetical protein
MILAMLVQPSMCQYWRARFAQSQEQLLPQRQQWPPMPHASSKKAFCCQAASRRNVEHQRGVSQSRYSGVLFARLQSDIHAECGEPSIVPSGNGDTLLALAHPSLPACLATYLPLSCNTGPVRMPQPGTLAERSANFHTQIDPSRQRVRRANRNERALPENVCLRYLLLVDLTQWKLVNQ